MTEAPEEPKGLTNRALTDLLVRLGSKLDFDVKTEVEASDSAYVDVVWFDKRLPVGKKSSNLRYEPVLPVVGFEIEWATALNAKHVKGSVSNLSNLGAQLGVIVIGHANLETLAAQFASSNETAISSGALKQKQPEEFKKSLCDRVYRWVYAEAQARGRIIVMFDKEVLNWAKTKDPSLLDALPSPAVSPAASL